jgi:N-hydroxyarylamine O-acetyltransferase
MCHFHQTSPDSHFTQARICSRLTEDGRISLSDMRFITTSNSRSDSSQPTRVERTIASNEEYADILREQFGIVMSSGSA